MDPASITADALTDSASGLDPQISPAYAREQVSRVAAARNFAEAKVAQLVDSAVTGDCSATSANVRSTCSSSTSLSPRSTRATEAADR